MRRTSVLGAASVATSLLAGFGCGTSSDSSTGAAGGSASMRGAGGATSASGGSGAAGATRGQGGKTAGGGGGTMACGQAAAGENDPYLAYMKGAPEYRPVPREKATLTARWNTWLMMPWRYQWDIGTGDAGGQFCRDYGINGGYTDTVHGTDGQPFAWLDTWGLKFYNDHTASKGYLYMRVPNFDYSPYYHDARSIRTGGEGPRPLDEALAQTCETAVTTDVNAVVAGSAMRVAYGLDDETSWGSYVLPLPWRVNDDDQAYAAWLGTYYGAGKAPAPAWVTPDMIAPQLGGSLGQLDFSPLFDRLSYNDSVWANLLDRLVTRANALDGANPVGTTGLQSPNAFGGFDYAKLAKKLQWGEAYDIGSAQAILRSFNPGNAMPLVTTGFHGGAPTAMNDVWQAWYYFAHGNRGIIGWVEGWFGTDASGTVKPLDWLSGYGPTLKELGAVQGPKLVGATFIHDGVGIYYSHPSVQVSYALDIEPHGANWPERAYDDPILGTSHNVRKAWENMLTDAGLQYSFVSYDQVAIGGVPAEYKALILPAAYALSDIEIARLRDFVSCGGVLIADFAPALFDQHARGRQQGGLDDLFGVAHTGALTKRDFFGGKLWVEADQAAGRGYGSYKQLLDTVSSQVQDGFAIAEPTLALTTATPAAPGSRTGLVNTVGAGKAVYLNLSPWRYLQYREQGQESEAKRAAFLAHLKDVGIVPWVKVAGPDGTRPPDAEVTYFSRNGRTYVLVVKNIPVRGGYVGGGTGAGVDETHIDVTIDFNGDVKGAIDERTGMSLGDGKRFTLPFKMNEAAFMSFEGAPPR